MSENSDDTHLDRPEWVYSLVYDSNGSTSSRSFETRHEARSYAVRLPKILLPDAEAKAIVAKPRPCPICGVAISNVEKVELDEQRRSKELTERMNRTDDHVLALGDVAFVHVHVENPGEWPSFDEEPPEGMVQELDS